MVVADRKLGAATRLRRASPYQGNFRGDALVGRDSVEPLSLSQSLMEPVGFYQRDTGRTVLSAHDRGVIPGGERSDDS